MDMPGRWAWTTSGGPVSEVIAAIVRKQSKSGEDIYSEGTLEILQDGFGFLRSPQLFQPAR